MKVLRKFVYERDAQSAAALLENEGIHAVIDGANFQTVLATATLGSVKLMVNEPDLWRANTVLEEADLLPDTPEWICGTCGKEVDAGFAVCWNCGADYESRVRHESEHESSYDYAAQDFVDPDQQLHSRSDLSNPFLSPSHEASNSKPTKNNRETALAEEKISQALWAILLGGIFWVGFVVAFYLLWKASPIDFTSLANRTRKVLLYSAVHLLFYHRCCQPHFLSHFLASVAQTVFSIFPRTYLLAFRNPCPTFFGSSHSGGKLPVNCSIEQGAFLMQITARHSSQPLYRFLSCNVLLFCMLVITGCSMSSDQYVHVYVDNGRTEPISVFVDDVEVAHVPAGELTQIKARTGERRFEVRCNDQTVYMATKKVEPSDTFLVMKRYLLNPDQQHRYMIYEIEYTTSIYELADSAGQAIDEARREKLTDNELAQEDLKELKSEFRLMPASDWFEIPARVFVMEEPPEVISTRSMKESRLVMNRMEPEDYTYVKATIKTDAPTLDDVDNLVETIQKSVF